VRLAELPVLAPMAEPNSWIDGVMDLVLHDFKKNEVWVLDWKTNRVRQNENPSEFNRRLVNMYNPQLQSYADCLIYLFPSSKIRAFIYCSPIGVLTEVGLRN